MTEGSHYVHGADPEEQARLSRLNQTINARCLIAAAPRVGERILDVGAGLGQFTRALARQAACRAVGVERDERQIERALELAEAARELDWIDLRHGEADALPIAQEEIGSFDLAHARFLLEHLADPLSTVREMARAVRPGGRLILTDDDHDLLRLYPDCPSVMKVWNHYIESYRRHGNDPAVGRKLVALIAEAGAIPVRCDWLFFGGCSGQAEFVPLIENMAAILKGAQTEIEACGAAPGLFEHALGELDRFRELSGAALWFAMAWAEGTIPA